MKISPFEINQTQLNEVNLEVYNSLIQGRGIFRNGLKRFLPQFNLPKELEYSPQKTEVKDPKTIAKFLWTESFMERISVSRIIMRNSLNTWYAPGKKWIFFPEEVAKREISEIEQILKEDLQFNLQARNENSPAERYRNNAALLVNKYDSDPRKLVNNLTIEQARRNLIGFEGIGTGIANLYIIYLLDRQIVSVKDPENVLLKVDIHKGRIPINTNAIICKNCKIHRNTLVNSLEKAYLESCRAQNLDPSVLDAALWVLGSEVCSKRDYAYCKTNCPLADKLCTANTPENHENGFFMVYDSEGKRLDTRKNINQTFFPFYEEI